MEDMKFVDGLLVTDTRDDEPVVTWPLLDMGVEVCLHISEVANCPGLSPSACEGALAQMSAFLGCICEACGRLAGMPEEWRLHAERD